MTSPADEQLSLNVFSGPAGRKRPPAPGQRWAAKQKRRRGCSQEGRQRSPAPGAKEQVRATVAPPPQPTARAPPKKKQRRQEEKEEREQERKEERKQERKEERKQEKKEERKQEKNEERKQEKKEERKQEKNEERKQEKKEERKQEGWKQEAVKETGRSSIKTSSLFKHNPSIPDITRTDVCQLKEEIFTSDSFSGLYLHPHLVATLNKVLNVSTLTSVQQQTIPALLEGRDALVRSQTGSGKTLSYAVPLVQSLQAVQPKVSRSDGPLALVIVPTRELALQTFQIFQKLLKPFTWIVPGVLMGGEKRKAEKARLRRGINVLVSTPGRLLDHIRNTLSLAFSAVRWLVLDEADRTLDLGFQKDLTVILNSLNAAGPRGAGGGPARQNVLLSATLTPGLTQLADVCLKDPVSIQVSSSSPSDLLSPPAVTSDPETAGQSESFAVPEELKQFVVVVPSKVRLVCLAAFILDKCKGSQNKVVVFVSSCEAVEFLHLLFSSVLSGPSANHKLSFLRLHGNMKQEDRSEAFQLFSAAPSGVLLCTDVAARGLDLPQVSWIVQFTPPPSVAEYVHRVGRTARMGGRGSSLLFLTPAEVAFLSQLEAHAISLSEMKLQDILSCLMLDDTYKGRGKYHSQSSSRARQQEVQERATVLQTQLEDFVHSGADSLLAAKKALQSYLRAYTCYPAGLRHVFSLASLHLGHAAKSFGLRDAPRGLAAATGGGAGGKTGTKTGGKTRDKAGTRTGTRSPAKNQKQNRAAGKKRSGPGVLEARLLRSEFSSGLQAAAIRKKKKKKEEEEE